ncbi:lipopolysaccharide assembly protein LapA domain-containing protein [Mumia flava]|uniref:lipopolysaccharide assembly protein LapA domain-containing protein n=1 Tax=Mumia flava TaxID=1348852 RepID=UPI0005807ECE|nr:LapA family protein [Mumia flava]
MNDPAPSQDPERTPGSSQVTSEQVRRFGIPAVIALAALLFILQNTDEVSFEFLWFDFTWPLWIMLLVFSGVGAIVYWGVERRIRSRRK